jgi:hypothetical protein
LLNLLWDFPRAILFDELIRSGTSYDSKPTVAVGGVISVGETGFCSGLSEEATFLVSQSVRESTQRKYDSCWKRFVVWSATQQIDPFTPSIESLANYLAAIFYQGLSPASLGVHRSASFSKFWFNEDRLLEFESQKILTRIFKGAFNA